MTARSPVFSRPVRSCSSPTRVTAASRRWERKSRNLGGLFRWRSLRRWSSRRVIYIGVGIAAIGAYGAEPLGEATRNEAAPLESVLRAIGHSSVAQVVAVGAMTAMLGVLLNLILGLSRVVLAMGRRGDLPALFAGLDKAQTTPTAAVIGVGIVVTALAVIGDVKVTWSFSAFTVLVYYAITNLAALRLPKEHRLYSRFFAWAGLFSCLFLAFWVETGVWLIGLAVLGVGLVWHLLRRRGTTGLTQASK